MVHFCVAGSQISAGITPLVICIWSETVPPPTASTLPSASMVSV